MADRQAPPPSEVATASDAFRLILSCQDENILVALRNSVSLADLARPGGQQSLHGAGELRESAWCCCRLTTPTMLHRLLGRLTRPGVFCLTMVVAASGRTLPILRLRLLPILKSTLSGRIPDSVLGRFMRSRGRRCRVGSLQSVCPLDPAVWFGPHGGHMLTCSVWDGRNSRDGSRCRSP